METDEKQVPTVHLGSVGGSVAMNVNSPSAVAQVGDTGVTTDDLNGIALLLREGGLSADLTNEFDGLCRKFAEARDTPPHEEVVAWWKRAVAWAAEQGWDMARDHIGPMMLAVIHAHPVLQPMIPAILLGGS